jgi:multicomponent Na+:H+ antiporter subunit C
VPDGRDMSPQLIYAVASLLLVTIGLVGALVCRHFLRKIMALNLMGSGVFLMLVAFAYRSPDTDPDPVPQAMVLTGIVVAVSATALALALARRLPESSLTFRLVGAPESTPHQSSESGREAGTP